MNQFFALTDEMVDDIVNRISNKLKASFELNGNSAEDELLTVAEAAKLVKLAVPTIYGLVHKNDIPFSKRGKRLYFRKDELLEWINTGRRTSKTVLDKKVDEYLFKSKFSVNPNSKEI